MSVRRTLSAVAASLIALVCAFPGGTDALADDFRHPLQVNISKFTGAWYELARTPNEFEDAAKTKGGRVYSACYDVRTEFAARTSRELRIRNVCSRQSPQGHVIRDVMGGLAILVDGSGGRKLKVAFGSAASRMLQRLFTGGGKNYWIYCLGPVNGNGRYDWAVTGGPNRQFVFLLTRDRTVPARTKAEMVSCARREGAPVGRLMYRQR